MEERDRADPLRDLEARRRQAWAAIEEAGGGESEGFELAEQELIDHASHGDGHTPARIMRDAADDDVAESDLYGEADAEHKPD
jgi:hypothetical protein